MLVYYPVSSSLLVRDTVNPAYEELILNFTPNTILYLDPNLGIQAITASHLPISCSWADNAGTAIGAHANVADVASSSFSSSYSLLAATASFYNEKATFLFTGSLYLVTASVALSSSVSTTSSYALAILGSNVNGTVGSATSSSYALFASTFPAVLTSGSTQNITSSWTNNVLAANIIGTVTSASYSITASFATNAGTAGGTTLSTGSTYPVTASWALSASQAFSASWAPFVDNPNATSASYATFAQTFPAVLVSGSLYQITSSYSQTASVYLGSVSSASFATNTYTASYIQGANVSGKVTSATTSDTASFIFAANVSGKVATATTSDTASYILASNVSGKVSSATTADTASYVSSGNVIGTVANATSASYAVTASAATSLTFTPSTASYAVSSSAATSITFVPNSATTSSYLNGLLFDNVSLTTSVTQSNIVVVQRITSSIHAAKYFYNVQSASNNRVGTIFGTWSGSTIGYSDNSDMDLGSTSQVSMSLAVSSSFVQLIAYVSDNSLSWSIYSMGNYI